MTDFSIAAIYDQYTSSPNPRLRADQADTAVAIVRLAELLAGPDLDAFGLELIQNGRHRLNTDPDDAVGQFAMDVALALASERQKREYLR